VYFAKYMLSKAQIKHISALRTKKKRTEHSQFIVEGKKCIQELLSSTFNLEQLYYTKAHFGLAEQLPENKKSEVDSTTLSKISGQKNPEGLLAVVSMPEQVKLEWQNKVYIALDSIRDPGNLGTIIRLADWYGVTLVVSHDCVDCYNPKVIQATMGSLFHTEIHYLELESELAKTPLPKIATVLNGTSVYEQEVLEAGIIIIGNEANGISESILKLANQKITIPKKGKAESLNAAMACGIITSFLVRS
jgi:TrmH family RNA methyltransferase